MQLIIVFQKMFATPETEYDIIPYRYPYAFAEQANDGDAGNKMKCKFSPL